MFVVKTLGLYHYVAVDKKSAEVYFDELWIPVSDFVIYLFRTTN